jgi:hypothetical protein
MAGGTRGLVAAVLVAASAALSVPALSQAVNNLSYNATPYSGYIEPVATRLPLVLALLAFIVLASAITENT